MGKATAREVIYRKDEDILIRCFAPPQPAVTLESGEGFLASVDLETIELITVEVMD
ncbi:MAG TPA: hypothetical protein VKY90_12210 [Candidatus Dormibacteraeota bacterium]|nr:hypothetical protein [Candidatus Dormibacteraeota bacterium]